MLTGRILSFTETTRKQDKQKFMGPDNSMVVTRGDWGRGSEGKGRQIDGGGRRFDFVHTARGKCMQMTHYRTVLETLTILLSHVTPTNVIIKNKDK